MIRTRRPLVAAGLATIVAAGATACSRDSHPTAPGAGARGLFSRYVAIGTSISAGVQSDGLVAASQETAWPRLLASAADRDLAMPYIDGTGCRSPLVAPLASGTRVSGEPAGMDASQLSCAPLRGDVTLPVQDVGINAALTKDALLTTPENVIDPANAKIYGRVLQSGATQVSTMMAYKPKVVSVELGANELLSATSGIAVPGVTLFPYDAWASLYDAVLDSVQKVTSTAVVVGLVDDVANFPAFRRGDELWANRAEFAAFNVTIDAGCQGNNNLIFVPVRVPTAVATGAAYAKNNLGAYTFSCAEAGPTERDYVLTPAEAASLNDQMHAMTAHIQSEATRRHFAYFALGALYDRPGLKASFSVVALMTTATPYGPDISLDGMHPSASGQQVFARVAAEALNDKFHLNIPID
jgi:lysophospholipase L1-like esterase